MADFGKISQRLIGTTANTHFFVRWFGSHASSTDYCKVVITGGSRGLGYALANRFLAQGDSVVISSRTPDNCDAAVVSLQEKHSDKEVYGFPCDVRNSSDVERLADYAQEKLGSIDIWINNAGISQSNKAKLEDTDPELLADVVSTNLLGSIYGARAALRIMKQQEKGGKVFFVDGTGAWGNPTPNNVAYGATKRALTQLKASLVSETKGTPISVHIFSPGMVATDLLLKSVHNARSAKFINILAEDADVVAQWLEPRIKAVTGSGKYFKFLTGSGVVWRFVTSKGRKNRFIHEASIAEKSK